MFLRGFRSGLSTQHALLNLLLNWQKCADEKGIFVALLMVLSKAYDCIYHELLVAKLVAEFKYWKNLKKSSKVSLTALSKSYFI